MSPLQPVNGLLAYITPRSPFISDFDPEDEQPGAPGLTGDVVEAREHYVEVGWVLLHICPARVKPTECFRPSTLRRNLDSIIDQKYVGVKTSRKQLEGDNALGDSPDQDESASQSVSSEGSAYEEYEGEEKVQSPDEEASEGEQSTLKNNQVMQENSSHEIDLATTVRQRRDEDREKGRAVTKQLVSIACCRGMPSLQATLLQLESLGRSTRRPYSSTKVCHSV
jgi:protein AATF/BFR2